MTREWTPVELDRDTQQPIEQAITIPPSIGRKVWFHPNGAGTMNGAHLNNFGVQPMDATVVYVWGDRMVNLQVIDHFGVPHGVSSVTLRQPGEPVPAGYYCEWMPFQVGQARKV